MSNLAHRRISRKKYLSMPLITKICECGCGKTFQTRNEKTKFINGLHAISRRYTHKTKLNKLYKEKPYLITI